MVATSLWSDIRPASSIRTSLTETDESKANTSSKLLLQVGVRQSKRVDDNSEARVDRRVWTQAVEITADNQTVRHGPNSTQEV